MSNVLKDHLDDTVVFTPFGSPTLTSQKGIFPSGSGVTSVASMPAGAEFHFDVRVKDVPAGDNYYSHIIGVQVGTSSTIFLALYVGNHGGINYVNVQPYLVGTGFLDLVNIPITHVRVNDSDLLIKDLNLVVSGTSVTVSVGNDEVVTSTNATISSQAGQFYFLGASLPETVEISKVKVTQ